MEQEPRQPPVLGYGRQRPARLGTICRAERAMVRMSVLLAVMTGVIWLLVPEARLEPQSWDDAKRLYRGVGLLCAVVSAAAVIVVVTGSVLTGYLPVLRLVVAMVTTTMGACIAGGAFPLPFLYHN